MKWGWLLLAAASCAAVKPEPAEITLHQAKVIHRVCRGLSWDAAMAGAERAMRYSKEFGVDYALLAAIVSLESSFNPFARSPGGAIGYGQLMPSTAQFLQVNPHDPDQNMRATARYLRILYDRFDDWDLAIASYRLGAFGVEQALKRGGLPAAARSYIQKVRARVDVFK